MAKPILLIHGAWHAKWCWERVTPLLAKSGHPIICIDLPGHGGNPATCRDISLTSYVDYVSRLIDQWNEPVVLVGHSFAGVTISQVAENNPKAIDQLIYVAAFAPISGESLTDEVTKSASQGVSKELLINLRKNESELIQSDRLNELFYNQCRVEDIDNIKSLLQKEPYLALSEAITLTETNFGKVKKSYIICQQDNSVLLEDQQRMCDQHRMRSIEIKADHSPFYSAPQALSEAILRCLND